MTPRWWHLIRGQVPGAADVDGSGSFLLEWSLTDAQTGRPITMSGRVYGCLHSEGGREVLTFGLKPDATTLVDGVLSQEPTPASRAAQAGWKAAQKGRIGAWSKRLVAAMDGFEGDARDSFHGGVTLAWKWRKTGSI